MRIVIPITPGLSTANFELACAIADACGSQERTVTLALLPGAEDRARDWREMRALRHAVDAALPADAVWLTPAATGPAPDFDAGTGSPAFNRVWTLLGLPCCTVPLLQSEAGMPMGVQVVGAMGNDRGVLSVADMLMARFGPA